MQWYGLRPGSGGLFLSDLFGCRLWLGFLGLHMRFQYRGIYRDRPHTGYGENADSEHSERFLFFLMFSETHEASVVGIALRGRVLIMRRNNHKGVHLTNKPAILILKEG